MALENKTLQLFLLSHETYLPLFYILIIKVDENLSNPTQPASTFNKYKSLAHRRTTKKMANPLVFQISENKKYKQSLFIQIGYKPILFLLECQNAKLFHSATFQVFV